MTKTWTERAVRVVQTAVSAAVRAGDYAEQARLSVLLLVLGRRGWWHGQPRRMAARVAKHGSPVWKYRG